MMGWVGFQLWIIAYLGLGGYGMSVVAYVHV